MSCRPRVRTRWPRCAAFPLALELLVPHHCAVRAGRAMTVTICAAPDDERFFAAEHGDV